MVVFQRYCYYIYNGVQEDMLAPHDKELMSGILRHVPAHMLADPDLDKLLANLKEEVKADYALSLMKAIGKTQHLTDSNTLAKQGCVVCGLSWWWC